MATQRERTLRDVAETDLPTFYEQQLDRKAAPRPLPTASTSFRTPSARLTRLELRGSADGKQTARRGWAARISWLGELSWCAALESNQEPTD